jgi:Fe-S-cluster containining protein
MGICRSHNCSQCCLDTEMPLTYKDITRIEEVGIERTFFVIEENGWLQLRNSGGKCIFLKKGLCSIYKQRPQGCRLYPLIYDEETTSAVLDDDCPYANEINISGSAYKRLDRFIEQLKCERKMRINKVPT